jgi:hypothetical protein
MADKVLLAQVFNVYGSFTPTKASAYLRVIGDVIGESYFDITDDACIDALNFSVLTQSTNKLIVDNRDPAFTGSGFLSTLEFVPTQSYSSVDYPITTTITDTYRIWIRVQKLTGNFLARVYINGTQEGKIEAAGPTGTDWLWLSCDIEISKTRDHIMSIVMQEDNNTLDKIYITSDLTATPTGTGPVLTTAPYITVNSMLYTVDSSGRPDYPLFINDYKTTRGELRTDDWYNFDLNLIDDSLASVSFNDRYALVLVTSGSNDDQYILWELGDIDEYLCGPSAFKVLG